MTPCTTVGVSNGSGQSHLSLTLHLILIKLAVLWFAQWRESAWMRVARMQRGRTLLSLNDVAK